MSPHHLTMKHTAINIPCKGKKSASFFKGLTCKVMPPEAGWGPEICQGTGAGVKPIVGFVLWTTVDKVPTIDCRNLRASVGSMEFPRELENSLHQVGKSTHWNRAESGLTSRPSAQLPEAQSPGCGCSQQGAHRRL